MQRFSGSLKQTIKRTTKCGATSMKHSMKNNIPLNNHILRQRQHAGALTMSPFFRDWESRWMEKGNYYSYLLHQDEQIRNYFEGLFYRLRVPSSEFLIERHHDMIIITSDLFIPEDFFNQVTLPEHLNYLLATSANKQIPAYSKENINAIQQNLHDLQKNSKQQVLDTTREVLGDRGAFEFYDCLNAMNMATQVPTELSPQHFRNAVDEEENLVQFYNSTMRNLYETEQEFEEKKRRILQIAEHQLPINRNLIEKIEQTITNYTGVPTYYVPSIFKTFPPIRSPKLVGETMRIMLEKNGSSTNEAFGMLKRWQKAEAGHKRTVTFEALPPETKKKLASEFLAANPAFAITKEGEVAAATDHLQDRVFPLAGMRVEIKGITKKATRKAHLRYQEWAADPDLTGSVQIDPARHVLFHSTQALRPEGMMGIKVWLSLKTRRTNTKGREIRAHKI